MSCLPCVALLGLGQTAPPIQASLTWTESAWWELPFSASFPDLTRKVAAIVGLAAFAIYLQRKTVFQKATNRRRNARRRHSQMWPFKRRKVLGAGPRQRVFTETDNWRCTCEEYECQCVNRRGAERTVLIDRDYKRAYNREYKRWRRWVATMSKTAGGRRKLVAANIQPFALPAAATAALRAAA